jgi:hypothetical protein
MRRHLGARGLSLRRPAPLFLCTSVTKTKNPEGRFRASGLVFRQYGFPPRHPVSAQESLLSRAQSSSADANSARWLWVAKVEAKKVMSLYKRAKAKNVPLCIGFIWRVNHILLRIICLPLAGTARAWTRVRV